MAIWSQIGQSCLLATWKTSHRQYRDTDIFIFCYFPILSMKLDYKMS